ncbi:hypothetical protein ACFSJ3_05690 [Corallincola platygyrae]|uniref:Uncharacterized protein n=1 Tax=Corallincola platygyrae TaxID=1193278 RepID=A0ABW4XL81_9GAMM
MDMDFNKHKRFVGFGLIAIGAIALIQLLFQLPSYFSDFSNSALAQFVATINIEEHPIMFGDSALQIPNTYLSIVTIIFGFMLLRIWLEIGGIFIKFGRQLLSEDTSELTATLEKLLKEKQSPP